MANSDIQLSKKEEQFLNGMAKSDGSMDALLKFRAWGSVVVGCFCLLAYGMSMLFNMESATWRPAILFFGPTFLVIGAYQLTDLRYRRLIRCLLARKAAPQQSSSPAGEPSQPVGSASRT